MAKVLVLGANGFLGSNIVKDLLKRNFNVRAFCSSKEIHLNNLEPILDSIEVHKGDFLNLNDLDKALKDIDYVFHMVSLSTPASSAQNYLFDITENVVPTVKFLELCVTHKIKKVIFPSSGGAIYGDHNIEKYNEETITDPISPYGISKLTIEKYLNYFYKFHDLDYLALRISNPYGVGQSIHGSQGLISIALNLIKEKQPITIYGDGSNVRDYIYISDMSNFICNIFDKNTKQKIYNVGFGEGYSINQILSAMKDVTQAPNIEVNYQPERKFDVEKVVLDISRIKDEFGFKPTTTLKEGLLKTWKYIQNG